MDAPARGDVFDDFADGLRDLFTALDDILENTGTDDMAKRSLRALNERLADVGDPECGFVRGRDVVVDDGGEVDADVVLCHANLLWHLDDLDLDIDLDEFFGQRVDFDETGVDSAVETTEFGDQANIALADRLVRVGADDAAGDGAAETEAGTEIVDCEFISMVMCRKG